MKNIITALFVLFALASCSGTKNGMSGQFVPGTQSDLQVNIGDKVYFALDSSVVNEHSQAVLAKQAEWLNKYKDLSITIEGHCDERGTAEYNIGLGDRRASAVRNALIAKGVEKSRIVVKSYGKERPDAIGNGEEIWSLNRRGVTIVTK